MLFAVTGMEANVDKFISFLGLKGLSHLMIPLISILMQMNIRLIILILYQEFNFMPVTNVFHMSLLQWVSHRNHRGNICGVDFIWLLNPNRYRKLLKTSWSETVFSMFKVSNISFLSTRALLSRTILGVCLTVLYILANLIFFNSDCEVILLI